MTACVFALTFPAGIAAKTKKAAKKTAQSSFEKINLNEVNAYDLKKIPGISSSKAKAIIAFREENGKIKSIEDLKEINHETKSGKIRYDFATSKGAWNKNIKILLKSGRLVCSGSKKGSKKSKKKIKKSESSDDEYSDEPIDY